MRRLAAILIAAALLLLAFSVATYIGHARRVRLVTSLMGGDRQRVLSVLGQPDRIDDDPDAFNRFQRFMAEEGLPLYPRYIAATGPVWHYNRASTKRLSLFFTSRGRVAKVVTTDWATLPRSREERSAPLPP